MNNIYNQIESNPNIMLGKPVIKGTRIIVESILRKLADGYSSEEITDMYPNIKKHDVSAVLLYAASVIENEEIINVA